MLPLRMPSSPRALHRLIVVRSIVASSMLMGCVEATAYEQATSAAEVQAEARRRLTAEYAQQTAELEKLRSERDQLRADNTRLQAALSERDGAVDQAQLELVVAKQEHSQETSLVQQLRGDLARVGTSLDVFADQKADLTSELGAARAENARLTARVAELENANAASAAREATVDGDGAAGSSDSTAADTESASASDSVDAESAESGSAEAAPPPPEPQPARASDDR